VRARFEGVAGQSFGAFLAAGVERDLTGEANDYVGKGMSGGRIVVRPPADDAGDPCLLGNTVLYGATGGELFCAGSAGERLAVRNSGATAVVEGTGDHACEYMTSGTVVILGRHGVNLGAGMSGGEVYVHDPEERLPLRVNEQLVTPSRIELRDTDPLRDLLERHLRHTGSAKAKELLSRWDEAVAEFWHVVPKTNVAALQSAYEGTGEGEDAATDAA
jgi:glutamate synthase (ferredoxin)